MYRKENAVPFRILIPFREMEFHFGFSADPFFGPNGCRDLTENIICILKDKLVDSTVEWSTQRGSRIKQNELFPPLTTTSNRFDVLQYQGN